MVDFLEKQKFYGVMIGRASYNNIWHLSKIDNVIFKKAK